MEWLDVIHTQVINIHISIQLLYNWIFKNYFEKKIHAYLIAKFNVRILFIYSDRVNDLENLSHFSVMLYCYILEFKN